MSSGELAFAVEKAAMEAFGAGQPRYFEFITRYAMRLKVLYDSLVCLCVFVLPHLNHQALFNLILAERLRHPAER